MNSINHELETVSHSKGKAQEQKVRRLENLIGDIMRSKDLTTEPQRHIDRLYLQCKEAISIFESEEYRQEEYRQPMGYRPPMGMQYVYKLYEELGHMSVKLKNAMTSPMDFYVAVIRRIEHSYFYSPEEESSLLKLIEANRNRNNQHLEESKEFIESILCYMAQGADITEAIELARKEILGVNIGVSKKFDEAVNKSGITEKEYISEAIHQRLEREGFLKSSEV